MGRMAELSESWTAIEWDTSLGVYSGSVSPSPFVTDGRSVYPGALEETGPLGRVYFVSLYLYFECRLAPIAPDEPIEPHTCNISH